MLCGLCCLGGHLFPTKTTKTTKHFIILWECDQTLFLHKSYVYGPQLLGKDSS
jgi:hypothetical protein